MSTGLMNAFLAVLSGLAGRVKPAMVEPVDVLQGGQFEFVEAAPWPVPFHELGLVQAVHRLGERVVVGISFTANGNRRTSLGKAFGVTDL